MWERAVLAYSPGRPRGCIQGPRGCSQVRRPGRPHRAASLAASTRSISGACSNTSRRAASFSNSFMNARHRRLPREPQDPNVAKFGFSDLGAACQAGRVLICLPPH